MQDLQHNATNIVSGKNEEEVEDPDYLQIKEYIMLLEGHLTEAHQQATRVIKKQVG
jgi:sorting nexin-1/2